MEQYLLSAALSSGRGDLLRTLDARVGECSGLLADLSASGGLSGCSRSKRVVDAFFDLVVEIRTILALHQ